MNEPVRMLVVEDNADDSDLLVRQLQENDFAGHVKVIPDGELAWNLLRAEALRSNLIAIFLDIKPNSLNGVKLLRKIKSRSALHDIPIVVMTSSDDPKDREECSRLGMHGYITKPVTYMAFANAIADLFQAHSSRKYTRIRLPIGLQGVRATPQLLQ